MSDAVESFQVEAAVAEAYEARFVPRLFAPWARHLVEFAGVRPGQAVLDVACGTGAVARAAADRLGASGRVTGTDLNARMLAVGARKRPDIEWERADASRLPFESGAFDVVLCQAALMFLPDPATALAEMGRVARSGGVVAVQVWDRLEAQPAYSRLVACAARHAGPEAVELLGAYWSMGDLDRLEAMFATAGLTVTAAKTLLEPARFDSIDELVQIELASTPLGERTSAGVQEQILADARLELAAFVTAGGAEVPLSGHLVRARPS